MKNQRVKIKKERFNDHEKKWYEVEDTVTIMGKFRTKEGETQYIGKDYAGKAVRFSPSAIIAFLSVAFIIYIAT